ncbi:MAG: hypothetical protein IME99_09575, partial [Proteobacteria bacterium]|nr:hypothetical protein [Pseudomonadota bacterium]
MAVKTDIRHEVISTTEQFGSMQAEWNRLLKLSDSNHIFLSWEWLWKWWNIYSTEKESLCIILLYRGEVLIGIAPFYRVTKQWKNLFSYRRVLFLGTTELSLISEYLDIISRPEDIETVVQGVLEAVLDEDLSDDLRLQKFDTSSRSVDRLKE